MLGRLSTPAMQSALDGLPSSTCVRLAPHVSLDGCTACVSFVLVCQGNFHCSWFARARSLARGNRRRQFALPSQEAGSIGRHATMEAAAGVGLLVKIFKMASQAHFSSRPAARTSWLLHTRLGGGPGTGQEPDAVVQSRAGGGCKTQVRSR